MKKLLYISLVSVAMILASCTQSDFEKAYNNPATVSETTVPKQFAGFLSASVEFVLPSYWDFFVAQRTTNQVYTQSRGFYNDPGRYVPGGAASDFRWEKYYYFLTQFREMEKVYATLSATEQTEYRIYIIAGSIHLYNYTQRMIDIFGDIPFSEAGRISYTNGNYATAQAKFDSAEELYTKMLDDLQGFTTELAAISKLSDKVKVEFETQDYINKGDLTKWKQYCNSLRLKLLTRASAVEPFKTRYSTEVAAIIASNTYVATTNSNIQQIVYNMLVDLFYSEIREALKENNAMASKPMIDFMNTNGDPRKSWIFEPGAKAGNTYEGLNPMESSPANQVKAYSDGKIALYNRSTYTRNNYIPGIIINATEVNLMIAEYYARNSDALNAKIHYELAIKESILQYIDIRTKSNDNTVAAPAPPVSAEVNNYLASAGVNFDNATTFAAQIQLIAMQKWLHSNVLHGDENWAEYRRLNAPTLTFLPDNGNAQTAPPNRWTYPTKESTFNPGNYEAVRSKDTPNVKIFWDID